MRSASPSPARWRRPGSTRAEHRIFDYHVVCLAGDGCLQEGVSNEAIGFAGHQKLDNLILIYDSNDVTLDAMADKTQSENTALRFKALGVGHPDGRRPRHGRVPKAFNKAKKAKSGKPQLIVIKTIIGKGIAEVQGTSKAHGEGGAKFADSARASLGLPAETFYVSDEVRAFFDGHKRRLVAPGEALGQAVQGLARGEPRPGGPARLGPAEDQCGAPPGKDPALSPRTTKMNGTRDAGRNDPPAGRRGGSAPDFRERRPARVHLQLHQGGPGFRSHQPRGAQHPLRHP